MSSSEEKADKIFRALSDHHRRKILDHLKIKPLTTGNLCEKIKDLDRCTVMQHLKVLELADLIIVKREGRFRWNYLNIDPIHSIYRRWISKYAEGNVQILTKLKADLEGEA
jgi:DNA-binding transcriptional ArsR family regulator